MFQSRNVIRTYDEYSFCMEASSLTILSYTMTKLEEIKDRLGTNLPYEYRDDVFITEGMIYDHIVRKFKLDNKPGINKKLYLLPDNHDVLIYCANLLFSLGEYYDFILYKNDFHTFNRDTIEMELDEYRERKNIKTQLYDLFNGGFVGRDGGDIIVNYII